jgi:hypothetical protein
MINVGQKMRCIKPCFPLCTDLIIANIGPIVDQVYTVRGFQNCRDGRPGIHLEEIRDTKCWCYDIEISWPLAHFRPLDEDKKQTDISVFQEILREASVPAAPIKIPEKV